MPSPIAVHDRVRARPGKPKTLRTPKSSVLFVLLYNSVTTPYLLGFPREPLCLRSSPVAAVASWSPPALRGGI